MACPTASQLLEHAPTTETATADAKPLRVPDGVYARVGKRALDLVLVLGVLPVALVFALPIALWNAVVFRDPRRIFFVQDRVGKQGRIFRMVKFRTMREPRRSATDSWFSGGDAARVTRFGRLLRNTHLDELPQLVNILRGDMHLVGPRPEMPDVHAWACEEVPRFADRLAVRPGLTGLAQVTQGYTGASAECYEKKLAIDVDYIGRLSFRTDLGIVLKTVPWVLQGRGWSWKKQCPADAEAAAPAAEPVADEILPVTRGASPAPSVEREYVEADAA